MGKVVTGKGKDEETKLEEVEKVGEKKQRACFLLLLLLLLKKRFYLPKQVILSPVRCLFEKHCK